MFEDNSGYIADSQFRENSHLLFVDSNVDDYQSLMSDRKDTDVILLNNNFDGVEQITDALTRYQNLETVEIVAHGNAGSLNLGNSQLNLTTLNNYTEDVRSWSDALTANGDILIHGCNVAAGSIGLDFVTQLSELTNADIAASDDLTGNSQLGGDWHLEVTTGAIESQSALNSNPNYGSVLATYNGNEYQLTSTATNWQQAQAEAEALGGNLVTINDAAEQQWLQDNFGVDERLWIGLSDRNSEGNFEWVSGSNADYTNWLPNQPDNFGQGEDFVATNWRNTANKAGKWNDVGGAANFRGIIEIGNDNPTQTEIFTYNGNQYRYTTSSISWQQAQAEAEALGGNLVTINDAAEQQWLQDTFGVDERLWIGLSDRNSEGNFEWVSGSNANYTNWLPSQPDNFGQGEDFVATNWKNTANKAGKWNDVGGAANFRGIIEIGNDNPTDTEIFVNGGSEYRLTTSATSWQQAQAEAESLGGNLVTVNDIIEEEWLSDTFGNDERLWIGLNDNATEGQFEWVSGENAPYRNWRNNQPDNFGAGEDFVAMNWKNGDVRWNDVGGAANFRGIIEVIRNPGGISLENNSFTVNETNGSISVEVLRIGGSNGTVTVDYQTANSSAEAGTDYTAVSGTLTFAPGETSKTVNIPIVDDNSPENTENFSLIIDNATGGANLINPRSASIAIIDNDGESFDFNDFSNTSELTLNGSTDRVGNTLRLTPASSSTGSAFFNEAITVDSNTSFQTQFQFKLEGGTNGASGFTFMLQNSSDGLNALGGGGFNLGYGGINNSLAIEFDNFDSGDFDPNNNHISLVVNGDNSNPLATVNAPFDLNNGASLNAWIEYNGSNNQLEVFLSDNNVKPSSPILTQNINLATYVGDNAFVGFSAAGAGNPPNTHVIENWNFATTADFVTPPAVSDLLPDLTVIDSSVTEGLRVDTTTQPGRALLRFTTEVANAGDGPLEIWADEVVGDTQDVFQRIYQDDGGSRDVEAGGFSYFEPHGHSHFDDFATFNLRRVNPDGSVGEIITTGDDKYSFCLINIRQPFPELSDNALIVDGRGGDSCGDIQGISVGYSDVYNSNLANQWIDVTDVPDGEYWLETIIDPLDRILETDDSNNVSRVRVTVDNPFV